jgi:8-amino-7-oxononanoate synthase
MSGAWGELEEELKALEGEGLRRRLRVAATANEPELELDGKRVLQFASNNYLGLATHPRVIAAAKAALDRYGAGSGAAGLITGHQGIHAELEKALAQAKGAEAALVYAAGSLANLGCLSALASPGDQILLDKRVHATLYDGAQLSGAALARFPHNDLVRLEGLLQASRATGRHRILIVADAIYSMDGDLAPLPQLLALAERYEAVVVADEAHSSGVLGARGHGILEHFQIPAWPAPLVLTGTLSKALGSLGGYVAGPRVLIDWLINKSRSFIFATALPGPNAAAALESLRVIEAEPERLQRLRARQARLARGLRQAGWIQQDHGTPILPVPLGSAAQAVALQQQLWDAGIFAPAIRPPTVPAGSCRLRLSLSSEHSEAQVDRLLEALGRAA